MTTVKLIKKPKKDRELRARVNEQFFEEVSGYCDQVGIDQSSFVRMAAKAFLKNNQKQKVGKVTS